MRQQPEDLCKQLNAKWIERYGIDSMSGNCGKLACMLRDAMQKHGFRGYIACGTVQGFEGNHAWVVYNGLILDPSVQQFSPRLSCIHPHLVYHEQRRMEFLR